MFSQLCMFVSSCYILFCFQCLSLLVQHGTLPDYHEEAKLHGKLHGCTCRKGESTKVRYLDRGFFPPPQSERIRCAFSLPEMEKIAIPEMNLFSIKKVFGQKMEGTQTFFQLVCSIIQVHLYLPQSHL